MIFWRVVSVYLIRLFQPWPYPLFINQSLCFFLLRPHPLIPLLAERDGAFLLNQTSVLPHNQLFLFEQQNQGRTSELLNPKPKTPKPLFTSSLCPSFFFYLQHGQHLFHGIFHTGRASVEEDDIAFTKLGKVFNGFCPHAEQDYVGIEVGLL